MIYLYNNTEFQITIGSVYMDATQSDAKVLSIAPRSWYRCYGKGIQSMQIEHSLEKGQLAQLVNNGRIIVAEDTTEYKELSKELEAKHGSQTTRISKDVGIDNDNGVQQGMGIYGKAIKAAPEPKQFKWADLIDDTDEDGIPLMKPTSENSEVDQLKAQIEELKNMMLQQASVNKAKPKKKVIKKPVAKKILKVVKKKAAPKVKPKTKVKSKKKK